MISSTVYVNRDELKSKVLPRFSSSVFVNTNMVVDWNKNWLDFLIEYGCEEDFIKYPTIPTI